MNAVEGRTVNFIAVNTTDGKKDMIGSKLGIYKFPNLKLLK